MIINKIFILSTLFTSMGLLAGDTITLQNSTAHKIRVHILDQNEKIYETKEIKSSATSTLTQCKIGRMLLVDWGLKEKDGRPTVVGISFESEGSCSKKFIFTSNLEIVEDKDIKLRPFSLIK
ncbi:MAG: hypothetical protein SFU98_13845 [Leptospiraceae bacterium]|nr:hypothetical protein [Leptospiraceae bacterium]